MTCRVCESVDVTERYVAREMMFGLRDTFDYVACQRCGAVQIETVPADMSRYYPTNYYSFGTRGLRRFLRDRRLEYVETGSSLLGWALWRWKPMTAGYVYVPDIPRDSAILELGCGQGIWLEELYLRGFRHLRGIDPYLPEWACRRQPFQIERHRVLDLVSGQDRYDLIFACHSLEHIVEQRETIQAIGALLRPGGRFRFLVPWISCDAWDLYRTDWVQFDAPRHIVLHSRASLEVLASVGGLQLSHLECNSGSMQFWGSEQYRKDIPLRSQRSLARRKPPGVFTQAQIGEWERKALELNARLRGDQIIAEMTRPLAA